MGLFSVFISSGTPKKVGSDLTQDLVGRVES